MKKSKEGACTKLQSEVKSSTDQEDADGDAGEWGMEIERLRSPQSLSYNSQNGEEFGEMKVAGRRVDGMRATGSYRPLNLALVQDLIRWTVACQTRPLVLWET